MTAPTKCQEKFVATQVDDEILVMHMESGEFFTLTDTAAAIWEAIDGMKSRSEIVVELAGVYDIDEEEISADVDLFLAQLAEADLIKHV